MQKIRLLLADDHAVLRAGLKTFFDLQPDMTVVGEAANGTEAVQKSGEIFPDIVLMDISMPGLGGVEATREIKASNPSVKVLALTQHEDESYLNQMLRAGADGYLPKKAADTELLDAIRSIFRGEYSIHSSMMSGFVSELLCKEVGDFKEPQDPDGLSTREKAVLRLLALGHTNQEIAEMLYLSAKTVETYKARIRDKLNLKGRAELVRYAIKRGLLDTEE